MVAALAIEGFMSAAELDWLAEQASTRHSIIEVGSFKGRSTKALADATPGHVYAVDNWQWQGPQPHVDTSAWESPSQPGEPYMIFRQNLAAELRFGKVFAICAETTAAADILREVRPDMIFIDADHDEDGMARDLRLFAPLLAPGGLLCGHDYSPEFPGVCRTVDRMLPGAEVAPGTSIWHWSDPRPVPQRWELP